MISSTRLWNAITGDLIRQQRYQIISVAVAITAIYILIFYFMPGASRDSVVMFLIFNDPVALGMIFTGSMYLFEKSENTLEALSVTPLQAREYLASKVITFSLLTLSSGLCMAFAAWGWAFSKLPLIIGVSLTASLFTMLGMVVVIGTRSFNEYIMKVGLYLIPVALPFLNFFGITNNYIFYLIPAQPALLLLAAARAPIPLWQIIYSIAYLLLWNWMAYHWALRRLRKLEGFS